MGTQLTGSCESSTELRLIEPTGIEPTGIEPTPIEPTGIEPTGIEPTGIEPTGIRTTGIEPTRIEPTGIEPTGIEADRDRADGRGARRAREGGQLVARQRAQRERLEADGRDVSSLQIVMLESAVAMKQTSSISSLSEVSYARTRRRMSPAVRRMPQNVSTSSLGTPSKLSVASRAPRASYAGSASESTRRRRRRSPCRSRRPSAPRRSACRSPRRSDRPSPRRRPVPRAASSAGSWSHGLGREHLGRRRRRRRVEPSVAYASAAAARGQLVEARRTPAERVGDAVLGEVSATVSEPPICSQGETPRCSRPSRSRLPSPRGFPPASR